MANTDIESLAPIECTVGLRSEASIAVDWHEYDGAIDGELTDDRTPRQDVTFDIEYDPSTQSATITNTETISFDVGDISKAKIPEVFILLADSVVINVDTVTALGLVANYDEVRYTDGEIEIDITLEFWNAWSLTSFFEAQQLSVDTVDRSGDQFHCVVCEQPKWIDSPLTTIRVRCDSCGSFQRFDRVAKN